MPLVIAGDRSGCGKTTTTLMLLATLRHQRLPHPAVIQSFKIGPDYIDPMFHRYVTGRPCYNLDPVLTSPAAVCTGFHTRQHIADAVLIEGVMGLFDGTPGHCASTAQVAELLDQPIALVIDCSRLSGSVAAIAQGYRTLNPNLRFAGVILNRVGSDRHLKLLQAALTEIDIPILGVLRRHQEISLPDRHLGLVPTDELPELDAVVERLVEIGATSFDWEALLPLLKPMHGDRFDEQKDGQNVGVRARIRIAVARDRAFNFHYAENLEILEQLGAELVFWSPLEESLPPQIQGLYLCGGFPEVFAQQLSENLRAREAVNQAIAQGLPTYAECGGLMYLCTALRNFEGQTWPMVGVLPKTAVMEGLTLGYRRAIAQQNSPLLLAGTEVWGHEFHHSRLEDFQLEDSRLEQAPLELTGTKPPCQRLFQVWGTDLADQGSPEGWALPHLHASYVHLHWGARPELPKRFLSQCAQYSNCVEP